LTSSSKRRRFQSIINKVSLKLPTLNWKEFTPISSDNEIATEIPQVDGPADFDEAIERLRKFIKQNFKFKEIVDA